MIGPMLVHYRKEFRSYNYFFSTVIGLNRQIAYVKAVYRYRRRTKFG